MLFFLHSILFHFQEGFVAFCGSNVNGCLSVPNFTRSYGYSGTVTLGDIENINTKQQFWKYEDDLIKSVWNSERCLGPTTDQLTARPYAFRLLLQDCPPPLSNSRSTPSFRHMRFIINRNGQIQSLAPVIDSDSYGEGGQDIRSSSPYCLTLTGATPEQSFVFLAKCVSCEVSATGLRQQFYVFGSSKPFLLPMQSLWGYQDQVELTYHVGFINGYQNQTGEYLQQQHYSIIVFPTNDQENGFNLRNPLADATNNTSNSSTTPILHVPDFGGVVSFEPFGLEAAREMTASMVIMMKDGSNEVDGDQFLNTSERIVTTIASTTFYITQDSPCVGRGYNSNVKGGTIAVVFALLLSGIFFTSVCYEVYADLLRMITMKIKSTWRWMTMRRL